MSDLIVHGVRRANRTEARMYFLCGSSTTPLWGKKQHPAWDGVYWGEPLSFGDDPCLYTFSPDPVTCPLCQQGRTV